MILKEDLDRLNAKKDVERQRELRRKEGILSYRMMRVLTNEIRKLKKANDFLCRKLREKTEKKQEKLTK